MRKTNGFSLIEILIVLAVIGLLASVFIPNLLRARQVSVDRGAAAYAQNVYKAGQAYLAENPGNAIVGGSCISGVNFGTYTAASPNSIPVTSCTYNSNITRVEIAYSGGTTTLITLGQ
jgi:type IV pilus assembly protein PilA